MRFGVKDLNTLLLKSVNLITELISGEGVQLYSNMSYCLETTVDPKKIEVDFP